MSRVSERRNMDNSGVLSAEEHTNMRAFVIFYINGNTEAVVAGVVTTNNPEATEETVVDWWWHSQEREIPTLECYYAEETILIQA